jgi:hypothetical protein
MIRKPKLIRTKPPIANTQTPGPGPVNARLLALVGALVAVVAADAGEEAVLDPTVPGEAGFGGVGVPFPPLIATVSNVSTALLVHVIGTFVAPSEMVSASGLPLVNCGWVIVMDVPWPAVIVPLCVAGIATAALVG